MEILGTVYRAEGRGWRLIKDLDQAKEALDAMGVRITALADAAETTTEGDYHITLATDVSSLTADGVYIDVTDSMGQYRLSAEIPQ